MSKAESLFQWYDRLGRPTLRIVGIIILAAIGLGVAVAMWRWAFGAQLHELPGTAVVVAFAPMIPQVMDQFTRSLERRAQIGFGQHSAGQSPNPHGGPGAP